MTNKIKYLMGVALAAAGGLLIFSFWPTRTSNERTRPPTTSSATFSATSSMPTPVLEMAVVVPQVVAEESIIAPPPVTPPRAVLPGSLQEWVQQSSGAVDAETWLAQGLRLAEARRENMTRWIAEDPERALVEALTPRQYARLPEEIRAQVERPVAAEGFYGVMAVCQHGEGDAHAAACEIRHEVVLGFGTYDAEVYPASIYGKRQEKMTVENDSLYGVVLDDKIALHEDEVVVVDDGPDAPDGSEGRYAVYYRGTVHYADTEDAVEQLLNELNSL